MNPTAETLPEDVTALHTLLLEAWSERDAERAENARLAGQNDRLRHLIRQLQRMQFGKRSEKLDPDQLNLGLEDLEQALAAEEADQEKADPVLRRSRAEKRGGMAYRRRSHRPGQHHTGLPAALLARTQSNRTALALPQGQLPHSPRLRRQR